MSITTVDDLLEIVKAQRQRKNWYSFVWGRC
jgi:hypothetical protein